MKENDNASLTFLLLFQSIGYSQNSCNVIITEKLKNRSTFAQIPCSVMVRIVVRVMSELLCIHQNDHLPRPIYWYGVLGVHACMCVYGVYKIHKWCWPILLLLLTFCIVVGCTLSSQYNFQAWNKRCQKMMEYGLSRRNEQIFVKWMPCRIMLCYQQV